MTAEHTRQSRTLLERVQACTLCADQLPHRPRPVLQWHPSARILIAGQAPGRAVHISGVPFDDPSGDRLRDWLGISRAVFYDSTQIAILPMGFCFPGSGTSGDLPPRPECAPTWRTALLAGFEQLQLTLVVGRYAQDYHFNQRKDVTSRVRDWRSTWPETVPLPHPSPRNNRWLKRNPWFVADLLPELRARVATILE